MPHYTITELLRAALHALNSLPNRSFNHPDFINTYQLCSAIDRYFTAQSATNAESNHDQLTQT